MGGIDVKIIAIAIHTSENKKHVLYTKLLNISVHNAFVLDRGRARMQRD
jgi:hypothetical protein